MALTTSPFRANCSALSVCARTNCERNAAPLQNIEMSCGAYLRGLVVCSQRVVKAAFGDGFVAVFDVFLRALRIDLHRFGAGARRGVAGVCERTRPADERQTEQRHGIRPQIRAKF